MVQIYTNMRLVNWRSNLEENVEKDLEDAKKCREKVLRTYWEGKEYAWNTKNIFWRIWSYKIS
jgi:hypothetical protein